MYLVTRYVHVGTYVPGLHPKKKKEQKTYWWNCSKKNKIKNNLNTELTEMGVFSAVAGNQLLNQLQKRVLPALFHLQCPSHHTNVQPVDAHVWRQLHLSAVARFSDSYCVFWYYLICFELCAQWPDTIMQICVECTWILAVTSFLVAFYVWAVGSGKPAYITKPHGVPTTKNEIMNNG